MQLEAISALNRALIAQLMGRRRRVQKHKRTQDPHAADVIISKGRCRSPTDGDQERAWQQQRVRLQRGVPSIYSSARPELDRSPVSRDHACMISSFVRARPLARPQTQDTKLLIYGLFQKGRVLAQNGIETRPTERTSTVASTVSG